MAIDWAQDGPKTLFRNPIPRVDDKTAALLLIQRTSLHFTSAPLHIHPDSTCVFYFDFSIHLLLFEKISSILRVKGEFYLTFSYLRFFFVSVTYFDLHLLPHAAILKIDPCFLKTSPPPCRVIMNFEFVPSDHFVTWNFFFYQRCFTTRTPFIPTQCYVSSFKHPNTRYIPFYFVCF